MIIKWIKKKDKSVTNITDVVGTVTWSGTTTQAAREASITVLNAPNDPNIKKLKLNLSVGDIISLYEDDINIFYGEIQTSEGKSSIGTVTYNARDLLGHLLRINHKGKFVKKTPEKIAAELCKKYGIKTTSIAKTKKSINKLIVDGDSIYDIVMIAYTKAAKATGKKYMCYMKGAEFGVKERGAVVSGFTLSDETNLTDTSYEETIENMVNQVKIYNDKGKQVGVVKNANHINQYGLYQEIYTKEKGINAKTAAKNLLNGVEKKVNANVIDANIDCVAGAGIKLHDAATGLNAIFWIDSDSHTWEGGRHSMNLELNFKNVMDSKTSDTSSSSKKSGSGTDKKVAGVYIVQTSQSVMRAAAGRSNKAVATLKKGTKVTCDGKYTYVSGSAWYHGSANGNSGYVYSPNLRKG